MYGKRGGVPLPRCFILLHDHDLGRLSLQTLLFYHGTRTTRWLSFERLCLPGLLLPPFNTNVDRPCVNLPIPPVEGEVDRGV